MTATTPRRPDVVEAWHRVVDNRDLAALDALVAENAVFSSPAVFTPQEGKSKVLAYLGAALTVFDGTGFRYVEEWYGDRSAVLEFATELDGVHVNGVDLIHWNDRDQITSFKVMIRPVKGLQALIPRMAAQLPQT
ncbi:MULTISPECIES: nuclear transport factor 2 family protein [unclassified Rhodococcus (in: high G+C Gram-positive bacteria)]|uniref:nuclear transport factor 2 family protein n=1 Tax=unclassified Rhodococcus (in: high G+C Gram-positive bacteria) TaxID=192944 RepID=UPI00163AEF79|nr:MULTISPECIES: nuclear transport factor 2 family protein [unclassified Rhodococcus (in: high G+C Gram-positive bacteria)]MBC2641311.1 nuclear transport factor 2 family protein [Rhodococcus sp. 3A]MBC2893944.1 nuclear transport factor 2 family protein [Rhodococcus sp. 4CII]